MAEQVSAPVSKKKGIGNRFVEYFFRIPLEHKGFGKQTFMLAKQDLIKTYKGAALGPLWAVMKPAFQLFVYWFAFTIGIRNGNRLEMGVPYFTFLMIGFIPWFFMSEAINRGSKSIRDNRQFVTKVSFPVSVIMTYTTLSKFYIHIFLFSIGFLYLTISGVTPTVHALQILIYAPLMFMFYLALLWSTAPMSAFSKDFSNLINTIMSGLFWLSGITYNSYGLESDMLKWVLLFNPITFFANGYRKALITHEWFFEGSFHPLWETGAFLIEFALVIIFGIYNYNRLRKEMPDVL